MKSLGSTTNLLSAQWRALGWGRLGSLVALFAVFGLILALMRDTPGGESIVKGYLMLAPLAAAALVPMFILDDPALELHMASPRPLGHIVAVRVALLVAIAAVSSAAFWLLARLLGIDATLQYAWVNVAPSLALACLATLLGLGAREALVGTSVVAGLWLFEVIFRGLFTVSPLVVGFYLHLGIHAPHSSLLALNQAVLVAVALAALLGCLRLARREERYL